MNEGVSDGITSVAGLKAAHMAGDFSECIRVHLLVQFCQLALWHNV